MITVMPVLTPQVNHIAVTARTDARENMHHCAVKSGLEPVSNNFETLYEERFHVDD